MGSAILPPKWLNLHFFFQLDDFRWNSASLHRLLFPGFHTDLMLWIIFVPPVKRIELWQYVFRQICPFFPDPKRNFVYCLRLHIDADHKKPSDERMAQLSCLLLNKMLQLGNLWYSSGSTWDCFIISYIHIFAGLFGVCLSTGGVLNEFFASSRFLGEDLTPPMALNGKAFWHLECVSAGHPFRRRAWRSSLPVDFGSLSH